MNTDEWSAVKWHPSLSAGWEFYVVTVAEGAMRAYRNGTACAASDVPPDVMAEFLDDDWRALNKYIPPWLNIPGARGGRDGQNDDMAQRHHGRDDQAARDVG